jgi:LPXTG-motif cell wall-anchored protein
MGCDSLTVKDSELFIGGDLFDSSLQSYLWTYNSVTGARTGTTLEDVTYQSAEANTVSGDDVAYYGDDFGSGHIMDGFGGAELSTTSFDNIHSLSYPSDYSALWFTNWTEGALTIGTIDPDTGNTDILTNNLRFANGDQWGTDAIFFGPTMDRGTDALASTGIDASTIAIAGLGLATAGAVIARRRRA